MQKQIFLVLAISTILTLFSCSKEQNDPVIDYYMTVSPSDHYQTLTIDFNYVRAIQDTPSSEDLAMRTVYIDPQELTFPTVNTAPVFLGQSSIEACTIHWFDIDTGELKLRNDLGDPVSVDNYIIPPVKTGEPFTTNYGDKITVTFELQIDESITENANGELNFQPVFITKVEQN